MSLFGFDPRPLGPGPSNAPRFAARPALSTLARYQQIDAVSQAVDRHEKKQEERRSSGLGGGEPEKVKDCRDYRTKENASCGITDGPGHRPQVSLNGISPIVLVKNPGGAGNGAALKLEGNAFLARVYPAGGLCAAFTWCSVAMGQKIGDIVMVNLDLRIVGPRQILSSSHGLLIGFADPNLNGGGDFMVSVHSHAGFVGLNEVPPIWEPRFRDKSKTYLFLLRPIGGLIHFTRLYLDLIGGAEVLDRLIHSHAQAEQEVSVAELIAQTIPHIPGLEIWRPYLRARRLDAIELPARVISEMRRLGCAFEVAGCKFGTPI